MKVSFKSVTGRLLYFGKNEGRDTYTLNIETEDGTDSYPQLTEKEVKGITIEEYE